ncbi:hypothetical protein ACERII_13960 [Evansella sp. AB-rgal1]|uniref:hypothetical protein n=1 Tax=Evansella sp. AB-rgal1 TaxID=3242696 RepID=UPI00359D7914
MSKGILKVFTVVLILFISVSVHASSEEKIDIDIKKQLLDLGFESKHIDSIPNKEIPNILKRFESGAELMDVEYDEETEKVSFTLAVQEANNQKGEHNDSIGSQNYENDSLEEKLLQIGYTKEQIQFLPEGYKYEIASEADKGIELESFTVMDTNGEEITEEEYTTSQIPENQFSLTTSVYNRGTDSNNFNTRRVTATFNWLDSPFWRLTDKIGIAVGDFWNIDYERGGLAYHATGDLSGTRYEYYDYNGEFHPQVGMDYNIPLKNVYNDEPTINHNGWVNLFIGNHVNQSGELDRTDLVANYYHKKVGLNGTISMSPGGPSISITNSTSYDLRQAPNSFDWVR